MWNPNKSIGTKIKKKIINTYSGVSNKRAANLIVLQ